MSRASAFAVVTVAAMWIVPATAGAQVFGTFVWQTQPYCNRLALTLAVTPGGFTVAGTDDGCGASRKASVTGAMVINADGTAGLRVSIAPTDGARAVDLSATVSTAHGGGTWSDGAGNGGAFVLGGALPGLPVRPAQPTPMAVADHPGLDANPCFDGIGRPLSPSAPAFCGYGAAHWKHGGLGLPGVQLWKDADGRVHLRGSAQKNTDLAGPFVLALPAGMRPKRTLTFTAHMSRATQNLGGTALVVVFGDDVATYRGLVAVQFQTVAADMALHFGEIDFTVDR
jgi:hypothetical protein